MLAQSWQRTTGLMVQNYPLILTTIFVNKHVNFMDQHKNLRQLLAT